METIKCKGISQSKDSPICGSEAKSIDHALLNCDFSSLVWSLWPENPLRTQGIKKSFLDSAILILSHSTLQDLEVYFAIAWATWSNRNKIVHNDCGLSPLQVWQTAKNAVDNFASSANWDFSPIRTPSNWVPPPLGIHKISEHDRFSSVVVIIRDCNGQVVAALCKLLQACYSAKLTEVIDLEQGVLLAQELQLPQVIFESDLLIVIQAINDKATRNNYGHLIQGILQAKDSFET